MLDQLTRLAEDLKKPIPGPDPWGEDPKYEERFEELKAEVAKMGGMGTGAPDWPKVSNLAAALIREKAKDLNLFAYLTMAWAVLHQLPGMVVGLELVAYFLDNGWDGIHPKPADKKVKPRGASLSWLQSQLMDRLPACQSHDRDLLERGMAASQALKQSIYQHFEDPQANFKSFHTTLSGWLDLAPLKQAPVPEPEPQPTIPDPVLLRETETQRPAPPTPASPPPAPSAVSSAPAAFNAPTIAENANPESLYETLDQIASQLATHNPFGATSFLLRRLALWDQASLPNHAESRETFFPAPPDEVVQSLKNMANRGTWESLLSKAEDLTSARWFWLDLQCYISQAARGLQLAAVAQLVEERTHALDQRLPDLKELKFNDGTPFAGPTTKDWLSQLSSNTGASSAPEDPAKTLLSDLRKRGPEGFTEALALAQSAIRSADSARTQFKLRLSATRYCLEVEQFYWAESLVQQLINEINTHQLNRWEPGLAGQAWSLALEIARELKGSDDRYLKLERLAMRELAGSDLGLAGGFPKAKPTY